MKKFLLTLGLGLVLSGCVAVNPQEFNNLKVRVINLETMVSAQAQKIKELEKQLKTLSKVPKTSNATLTPQQLISLKTQIISELEDIKSQQDLLSSEIDDLKFNQEELSKELRRQISALNSRINLLQAEIDTLKASSKQPMQNTQTPNITTNATPSTTLNATTVTPQAKTTYLQQNATISSNASNVTQLLQKFHNKLSTNATLNATSNVTQTNLPSNVTSNKTTLAKNATLAGNLTSNATIPKKKEKPLTEAELYEKAFNYYKQGEFTKALSAFKEYLQRFPNGKWIGQAYFWIGECYFHLKDYEEAILSYEKLIEMPEFHPLKPAALFRQALAFKKLGDNEAYQIILKKLIQTFPYSKEALKAKQLLNIQ